MISSDNYVFLLQSSHQISLTFRSMVLDWRIIISLNKQKKGLYRLLNLQIYKVEICKPPVVARSVIKYIIEHHIKRWS